MEPINEEKERYTKINTHKKQHSQKALCATTRQQRNVIIGLEITHGYATPHKIHTFRNIFSRTDVFSRIAESENIKGQILKLYCNSISSTSQLNPDNSY